MLLYNYTTLRKRDAKIYNVGGYDIAGGMSVEFLKVVGPFGFIGIVLGCVLGMIFNISFFNPFAERFYWQYTVFWLILGFGSGCILWYVQFAGYRLYQYLSAYLKPKKVYMNDFKHSVFKLSNIKIKTFVKNTL